MSTRMTADRGASAPGRQGRERVADVNDVHLCLQSFGDDADAALLLIAGATWSMDWWDDELCRRLAAGGRHVLRYDQRDTGRSSHDPAGAPTYTGADLVRDAVGILDHEGIDSAHVMGLSSGGGVAQHLALTAPHRVASLVLISTSPAVPAASGELRLPPASSAVRETFDDPPPEPDWSDPDDVARYVVDAERPYAGSLGFDEARVREVARRVVERTLDVRASLTNFWLAADGEPVPGTLADIAAPTLILHGTADPCFPYEHAEALAREIPHTTLVPLEGGGHEMPAAVFHDIVVEAVLAHTRRD
ncbi:alpha/beta hydrolase fold protein [Beutenbergia cavernae DSM 12333]|uniref:Alpha/beta hydrolase fold protein n=1 Tax=Beutenbergia cavernae (strain ATCC BAA-8 / DSM 12333 / CCUG 43141 / JCM 11478 / NBRC 16432 / NCIMB 13614 / HKI 0122) TaxID=471853 RepID=C5BVM8_BEUC1|nr:alpha/beta hydrolase [Beutenbergia cavernae]ACQ78468.1 alpha/beta hydrolase fold protein [Beutenbergia cavernae DSM 12333]